MIVGIGSDIIEIKRIAEAVKKDSFKRRCFAAKEEEYAEKKANGAESLAGFFCAKEAVSKALGTGFSGFGPADIEVCHGPKGEPVIALKGGALERANEKGVKKIHISLSHCRDFAMAYVVLEA